MPEMNEDSETVEVSKEIPGLRTLGREAGVNGRPHRRLPIYVIH